MRGKLDDLALLGGQPGQGSCSRGGDRDSAGSQLRLGALSARAGPQLPERLQGGGQNRLGVVDAPLPSQPLAEVEAELGAFKWPLRSGRIRQSFAEVIFRAGRFRDGSQRPAHQLVEPRRADRRGLEGDKKFPCLRAAPGADGGGSQVGDGKRRNVVVQRLAVRGEQLPELVVGDDIVAVGESGDAESVPGPGDH
jgi:hypothetical protein